MNVDQTPSALGEAEPAPSLNHKDWMILLWSLRIAIHIPEVFNRENHRLAADNLLGIIAPWIPWPDHLLQAFSDHLQDEPDSNLILISNADGDETLKYSNFQNQLKQVDCSLLSKPFQAYYHDRKNTVRKYFEMAESEVRAMTCTSDRTLVQNTQWLSDLVGLSDSESEFLLFSLYVTEEPVMKSILHSIPFTGMRKAASQLAKILDREDVEMQRALNHGGKLHGLGLFKNMFHLSDLEDLIPNDPKIHTVLSMDHNNSEALVDLFLERSQGTKLSRDDFEHLKDALDDLTTIIQNALKTREKGVNILFYGPPGTGKTQLSRLIAQTIGCSLYEVRWSDEENEPATATERLMGLELGQNFLKNQSNAFLLFDEVEAVFEGENDGVGSLSRLLGGKSHARNENKAWINQTLDNHSAVPTIWIANEVDRFDPAFLRRFIYCLEFTIPPRSVRRRAINRYMGDINLSESFKNSLAAQWISPAQIETSLRSTRLLKPSSQRETEVAVLRSIKASMAVMGQEFIEGAEDHSPYRLEYLNIESPIPVDRWVEMAKNDHPLSICLAGPPGCGKSQLARYLADQLDKPLLAKRGSDLLDKWVGGTEANLAAMFREAKDDRAILLLDEADSMLRNREQASQAWQVNQVNELLQQMESFSGIFICTTNRFEDIDPAALRRFSLKVKFHAMTSDQRWQFLLEMANLSDNDFQDADRLRLKLDRLDGLTPGDFAVAARQFRMLDTQPTPEEILAALEQEMKAKNWNRPTRTIGFLH